MNEDEKRERRIKTLERLFPAPRSFHAWWHYQLLFGISRMCNFSARDKPVKVMVDGKEVTL